MKPELFPNYENVLDNIRDGIDNLLLSLGLDAEDVRMFRDKTKGIPLIVDNSIANSMQYDRSDRSIRIKEKFAERDMFTQDVCGFDERLLNIIYSQLGHEMLHAYSHHKTRSGIKNISDSKNVALNEGITQMFAELITGKQLDESQDKYFYLKKFARIITKTFGLDNVIKDYFYNENNLCSEFDKFAGNDSFANFNNWLNWCYKEHYDLSKSNQSDKNYEIIYEELFRRIITHIVMFKANQLQGNDREAYLDSVSEIIYDMSNINKFFNDACGREKVN